jgi:hypothetical protein
MWPAAPTQKHTRTHILSLPPLVDGMQGCTVDFPLMSVFPLDTDGGTLESFMRECGVEDAAATSASPLRENNVPPKAAAPAPPAAVAMTEAARREAVAAIAGAQTDRLKRRREAGSLSLGPAPPVGLAPPGKENTRPRRAGVGH